MDGKIILKGLILILIVSLAFAAIYATETEETHNDSSNGESHLYISGSGDVSHVLDSENPIHANDHLSLESV